MIKTGSPASRHAEPVILVAERRIGLLRNVTRHLVASKPPRRHGKPVGPPPAVSFWTLSQSGAARLTGSKRQMIRVLHKQQALSDRRQRFDEPPPCETSVPSPERTQTLPSSSAAHADWTSTVADRPTRDVRADGLDVAR